MTLRERLASELKAAMKARDAARLSTLRLIQTAVHDRDIAARTRPGGEAGVSDEEIIAILGRMVRQRQESVRLYEEGGRLELAEKERAEIAVIAEYLPPVLGPDELAAAIAAAIADTGAGSIRDMGRVMALLRERHAGQIDFAVIGPAVRDRLS